jgi:glutathione S-transferase
VADAHLATVRSWAPYAGIDLAQWPAVQAYNERLRQRPSVARALAEETALWQAEQARRNAA